MPFPVMKSSSAEHCTARYRQAIENTISTLQAFWHNLCPRDFMKDRNLRSPVLRTRSKEVRQIVHKAFVARGDRT
jgi:hypothetical protein